MKVVKLFLAVFALLLMSCDPDYTDVDIIDNPSLSVSPSQVQSGDTVIITFNPGERTNNTYDTCVFYWEDEEIGRTANSYQLEYTVGDVEPGYYHISCHASYEDKNGSSESSGFISKTCRIWVVE